jgi:hypothetical protein
MERLAGVEPAISALATQRLTARLQPLIMWLREGDSNPNHPRFQKTAVLPLDDPGIFTFHFTGHTSLIHVSYSTDIVTNWLASKASNLGLRVQSAVCCQLHYSPLMLAAQVGVEPT